MLQATLPPGRSWGPPRAEAEKALGHISKRTSLKEPNYKPLRSRRQIELGQLALSFHICEIIPKIIIKHNVVTLFFGNAVLGYEKILKKRKRKSRVVALLLGMAVCGLKKKVKKKKKKKARSLLKSCGWRFCDNCPAFRCLWEGKGLWWQLCRKHRQWRKSTLPHKGMVFITVTKRD